MSDKEFVDEELLDKWLLDKELLDKYITFMWGRIDVDNSRDIIVYVWQFTVEGEAVPQVTCYHDPYPNYRQKITFL